MNLNDYQQEALKTASPKDKKDELFNLLLGLSGEASEIAEKVGDENIKKLASRLERGVLNGSGDNR